MTDSSPAHGAPDAYAVIGNPIRHSQSPRIHALFAQATRQHMCYRAIEGRIGHFAQDVQRFCQAAGRGLNVTAPFKLDAYALATQRSEAARLAQAANALKFSDNDIAAENFDGAALVRDVVHNLGHGLRGRRVLLLGAGGAARGALLPLLHEQPASLVIANRTVEKARDLANLAAVPTVSACAYDDLKNTRFDVVFNATSASWQAHSLALPTAVFAPAALAYDLSYGQGLTPFLQQARSAGAARLADGVGMLVEQAALSFAWWRGVHPPTQAVIAQLSVPLV